MTDAGAVEGSSLARAIRQIGDEIASARLELPLLPGVAAEVLSSSLEDQQGAGRLADLLQEDQVLADHMLRVVNSPAFRGANEIAALRQAIARLGLERIRQIALSASLKRALAVDRRDEAYAAAVDECWQISLASGLWAKSVARICKQNAETAYLCGLLHNVGAAPVLHRLGALDDSLSRQAQSEVLVALVPAAGAALARAWALPPEVVEAIEHHASFDATVEDKHLVAVTAIAAALGRWMCSRDVLISDVLAMDAASYLGFGGEDADALLEELEDIRESMESMSL